MIIKNEIIIICLLLLLGCKYNTNSSKDDLNFQLQNEKTEIIKSTNNFESTVYNVIKWYADKNQDSLNSLINNNVGLYLLFSRSTYNEHYNLKKLCLEDNCVYEENIPEWVQDNIKKQKVSNNYKITYDTYPTLKNCEEASKEGIFIDTIQTDRFLTETIKNYKIVYAPDDLYSDSELKKILEKASKIEDTSRKIILTKNTNGYYSGHFIFYLTYIDEKWYLTIIDFASLDCSV